LLDLARRVFPNIQAAFVSTGMEYRENMDFIASVPNVKWMYPEMPFTKVIETYGYPVISKEVAKRVYYAKCGSGWAIKHLARLNTDGSYSKFNQRYVKWVRLVDAPFLISERCCHISNRNT
jgi:hypothetical protein